ncbi:MAG: DUF2332 family protein [Rhodobacteraceae bacterium]|nr:MAG: DUF2332 family protein [Paracoccaceae bacterium]
MNFRTHARLQAEACDDLGSPFTARLLRLFADSLRPGTAVADRLLSWPGEQIATDAPAQRLAGALHYLVLSGQAPVLARLYKMPEQTEDAQLWRVLEAALRLNSDAVLKLLDRPLRTQDMRCAAICIAAAHWVNAALDVPFILSELGSGAGMNLLWDHYALKIGDQLYGPEDAAIILEPEWRGSPPPVAPPLIRTRAGCDLAPLDPAQDRWWILSQIGPDEPARRNQTELALDLVAEHRPEIKQSHPIDWLEAQLARPVPGALHFVVHMFLWPTLSAQEQARGTTLLSRAGLRAREEEPIAHLSVIEDDDGPGAAIVLELWPGEARVVLGRADLHGRWVDWQAPDL